MYDFWSIIIWLLWQRSTFMLLFRQDPIQPRLVSNSLYYCRWPWTLILPSLSPKCRDDRPVPPYSFFFFCSTGGGWTQGFMHIKQLLDQLSYIPRQEKLRSWFISFCAPAGNFSLDISAACLPQFYSLNSVNMLLGEPSKELSGLWFCRSLGLHLYWAGGLTELIHMEFFLSFHLVDPGDWMQVLRSCRRHPY